MATAPYRQFWKSTSNVSEDRRIVGSFAVAADGSHYTLGTFVRPSAGSAATSGLGNMFTVTQSAQDSAFFVSLTENVVQAVTVNAWVVLQPSAASTAVFTPTNATTATCVAGHYDSGLGGFWIAMTNPDGSTLTISKQPPTGYTWRVQFELVIKPTFVPASL